MRWNAIVDTWNDRPGAALALGLTAVALALGMYAIDSARRAAEHEASWLRQRLTEKRALVRALNDDLAAVAVATERVSQMASIARDQNAEVRKLAQIEEPRDRTYTPDHLADLDDATVRRSEDGERALSQLAFLDEQLASTTDSLSLMIALSKGMRPVLPKAEPPAVEPTLRLAVARVTSGTDVHPVVARVKPAQPTIVEPGTPSGFLPVSGDVSSPFGWRLSPWGRGRQRHTGVDIRAEMGTPVRTSGAGEVVFAGRDSGGYGSTVVIDHGRNVKTLYGHLSGIYVRKGQRVPRGTVVGAVGSTGRSTGAHLHYEVRVGNVPVDPLLYTKADGIDRVASASQVRASR